MGAPFSWYFETGNPPFVEHQNPAPGETGVSSSTSIDFYIVDAESYVRSDTIDAYVNGVIAYHNSAFMPPFTGHLSFLSHGSTDGYDAWSLEIFNPTLLGGTVLVRAAADDYGFNVLDTSWSFQTATAVPFIDNQFPAPDSFGNPRDTLVKFDIAMPPGCSVNPRFIDAYVEGMDAYHGRTGFVAPFNGPHSSFAFVPGGSSWGYNVYRVIMNKTSDLPITVPVRATYSTILDDSWAFYTTPPAPVMTRVNAVYFSDAQGIKKIQMTELVGESQNSANIILSTRTVPPIPDNIIDSMHGAHIGNDFYLTFSLKNKVKTEIVWGRLKWDMMNYDEDIIYRGCFIVKNDVELNQYADGYKLFQPKLNNRGVLYVINKDTNSIEVYYGTHFRPDSDDRDPDYIYNSVSMPALLGGEILCLYIVSDASWELPGGTRLYIGTTKGVTIVDTYDAESPTGYSAGHEYLGKSHTYGIIGSETQYPILGGTVSRVVAVSSNEDKAVVFVATNDGYGNGGLSQVLLTTNKRTAYMTQANELIPSNNVRDISGKDYNRGVH